jgi:putative iron-dependent peroxidase
MDTPKELNEIVLPQTVVGPLTRAAIFLVVCIRPEQDNYAQVRSFCADLSGLVRAVEFRDAEAGLTCVVGFGSDAWDKLFGSPRPAELHPFREIRSGGRHAVSTPGDILFHIRAKRPDLCFELAAQIMDNIGDVFSVADDFMASAISMIAMSSGSSTGQKIHAEVQRKRLQLSVTKIQPLRAAATSSSRSIFTT